VTGTEWLLLIVVILVPLIVAVMVTKWTLDQALKRSRKNRDRRAPGERVPTPLAAPVSEEQAPTTE